MSNKTPDAPSGKTSPSGKSPKPPILSTLSTPPAVPPQPVPQPAAKPAPAKDPNQPITQARSGFRSRWPMWAQQLPYVHLPEPKAQFGLIDMKDLESVIQNPDALRKLQSDMRFIDEDLL